ncbi:Sister-chromatid cohesion protein 3 [Hibiscus syriacus]|uniref:Sister-chromatid cohesion protein 3 n=1 Tax=Hibiscus syriacus TaxID=106335 RepID=A0A6A2YQE2_HIBSY|nr:Sister-chromatid cohesion protein 3 [Hibiscus syriacus]
MQRMQSSGAGEQEQALKLGRRACMTTYHVAQHAWRPTSRSWLMHYIARSKRARADTGVAGDEPSKANGDNGENEDVSSDGKVVKGDGKHISQVVKRWVERYERNPKPAMVELLMMLFEVEVGFLWSFTDNKSDSSDIFYGEVENYQGSKKKEFKNIKENFVSFWHNLVIECQNGALFDKQLFDKCMDYIIELSCTPPRVNRQAASMMGLQLVTSFISVAKWLVVHRDTTQRQVNAERKKRADGPPVESLNNRLSATHEQKLEIDEMIHKIFTGLFVYRYRDNLHLKYLGWTLNDKSVGIRKVVFLALQNLYEVEDNVPTLSLFTERFSNRMIELVDDVDVFVVYRYLMNNIDIVHSTDTKEKNIPNGSKSLPTARNGHNFIPTYKYKFKTLEEGSNNLETILEVTLSIFDTIEIMASTSDLFYMEDSQPIKKHLYINGAKYRHWKKLIKLFIQSNDLYAWEMIENDNSSPTKKTKN